MTCENQSKQKIKNIFSNLFDILLIRKKLTDYQLECMQFGICDYSPREFEEVPFFHY